jgi:hypothetical protein
MKKQIVSFIGVAVMSAALLTLTGGHATAGSGPVSTDAPSAPRTVPMTPDIAAKKEMVRKQQAQRVSDFERKTAGDSLKAERLKVYQAQQLTGKTKPKKVQTPK